MNTHPVKHLETGRVYRSMRSASRILKIPLGRINGRNSSLPGFTFERTSRSKDALNIDVFRPESIEKFKPIPGYETEYEIGHKGTIRSLKFKDRFKKPSTNKQGQHVVVLFKNSSRKMFTVESLYKLVWESKPLSTRQVGHFKGKKIRNLDDGLEFSSYIECCKHYRIDNAKFGKAARGKKKFEIVNRRSHYLFEKID